MKVPETEIEFTFVRSSGPGGQNVNKVNSKAVLRWNVMTSPSISDAIRGRFLESHASKVSLDGDLILTSDAYRDQGRNREDCLEKLEAMLTQAWFPPKVRKKTKMSWSKKMKNKESKKMHSARKQSRSGRHSD